jgi:hypothetical protein
MWASYKKSKSYANLATSTSFAQYGSFLCSFRLSDTVSDSASRSVIMVNVASSSRSEHPWIGTTGATNPVTGNRPLFVTFPSMGKGGHQVKTANIRFVAAEGPGVIMFYVNRPKTKHAKIVRQHVFYLATCSKNTLLRNTQSIQHGVNCDSNLNGAMACLRSILIYEAPLINCRSCSNHLQPQSQMPQWHYITHRAPPPIRGSLRPIPIFVPQLMIRIS